MSSLENSDGNDDETGIPGTRPTKLSVFRGPEHQLAHTIPESYKKGNLLTI